ncbi:MAG: hypothetical protein NXI16_12235 [Alphaproteobacteria bacterium]|nr:hypothetical protein [Alphaproteobacteria bacterium]
MTAAFAAMAIAQQQTAPTVSLEKLISTATRLVDLLKRENDFLAKHDLKAVAAMTPEKNQLTADYAKLQSVATENPDSFRQADPEKQTLFQKVVEELKSVLMMNERALRIALTAGERIIKHVKEAVQTKRSDNGGYTAEGQYHARTASAQQVPALYNKAV